MQLRFILTGGIGSGKSAAAEVFRGLGAEVISADEAGHAVLAPGGEAAGPVARRWPEAVRGGVIDRAALAALVFSNPEALAKLESLTHPAIASRVLASADATNARVVIVETPVARVVGEGWPRIVVDAREEIRLERLRDRGIGEDDIRARMARQPTRGEWLAMADYVIDNSGTLAELRAECQLVWGRITRSDDGAKDGGHVEPRRR